MHPADTLREKFAALLFSRPLIYGGLRKKVFEGIVGIFVIYLISSINGLVNRFVPRDLLLPCGKVVRYV